MLFTWLQALEKECLKRGIPILGKEKGTWLHQKVKELKPSRILELGTANGYSGIILGSEGAQLHTIELNPFLVEEAEKNFAKFKVVARVITGDAIAEVKNLAAKPKYAEKFDLIFIDFTKSKYIEALPECLKLVRKGGAIIADNITFTGCQDYKEAVLRHPQLKTEIISIRDGLSYSVRTR